jgi:negative regulator of sigma E activity
MTEARYHELLSQLLDGSLTEAEAEEMRQELERDPRRLQHVREHLMFSEVLAQEHSPHRSAETFCLSVHSRLGAETEMPADVGAPRSQPFIKSPRGLKHRRLSIGIAAGILISIVVISQWPGWKRERQRHLLPASDVLGSTSTKATLVSLHGEVVCTHCDLRQTSDCQAAVRVREEGHEKTFFLSDNAISRDFNRTEGCDHETPLRVLAEGLVQFENGHPLLAATRLEVQR